jgi:hypothetical protein
MSFGNPNGCARIHSYEAAHKYFEVTPRSRAAAWSENERPLDDARKHHYRVRRGSLASYYDVMLYRTPMARYYAPATDGSYRVCYTHDSRSLSQQFMGRVLGIGRAQQYRDTQGALRYVPIGGASEFGTDLQFNSTRRLIVEDSTHAPIATAHASPALAAWKKELRAYLGNLPPLMEIAVQDTLDAGEGSGGWWAGAAFTSVDVPYTVHGILQDMCNGERGGVNAQQVEALRDLYVRCAKFIIDRRLKKEEGSYRRDGTPYTQPAPRAVTISVMNWLTKHAPMSVKRLEYRPLAPFPTELPPKWVFA